MFDLELSWIQNDTIREFTQFCLDNAPPYFWENPASSTGKYHSGWSNMHGGLVHHSRAVAYMTKELARSYQLEEIETDAAIAAAILHDVTKYGLPGNQHTTKDHDLCAALYLQHLSKQFPKPVPMLQEICSTVLHHFGPWTSHVKAKKFPEEYSRMEQLVHVADMVASRKEISFTFIDLPAGFG